MVALHIFVVFFVIGKLCGFFFLAFSYAVYQINVNHN